MATAAACVVDCRGSDIKSSVRQYRDIIIRHVRCGSILPNMCFQDDDSIVEEIRSLERNHRQREACRVFLEHMENNASKQDFVLLLQVLEQNEYTYVVKLLKGDETLDPSLHRQHCRLIQFFSQYIERKIDIEQLFPRLIEEDLMDDEDREHLWCIIRNSGSTMAARWFVLTVLPRRKEDWYKQFLTILEEHGYQDLVIWIDDRFIAKETEEEESVMETEGSELSMEFEEGMNILTGSGEAYTSVDLMDPIPARLLNITLNITKPEMMTAKGDMFDGRQTKTDVEDTFDVSALKPAPVDRVKDWIHSHEDFELSNKFNREPPDSVSEVSSYENNSMYDIDEDDLISPELLEARDQHIRPLENRPYQEELARDAGRGRNVIIIAPTGCGKTVVALNIIQTHLSRMEERGQKGRVAFFANEVTLVDQQHELCRRHLSSSTPTMMIVGETKYRVSQPLPDLIQTNDVLVMTPQIIVDALESKTLPSLDVFTLVIFDECHHVRDKHPTNQIMCHYMEQLHSQGNIGSLPQIVGFTASVGVGKQRETSREKDGARDHILKLCANLNATGGLITVREHKESLSEYANCVETAIEMAPEREEDLFKKTIGLNIMTIIEDRIINKQMESEQSLKHIRNIEKEVKPCLEKGSAWYTQWLGKLHNDKFLRIKDATLRRFFLTCVQHLSVYNKALLLNSDCRAYDAWLYLDAKMKTLHPAPGYRTDTDEWLYTLYRDHRSLLAKESRPSANINPKLNTLQLLIQDQIKKKKDSRIIVLVQTRDLARALVQWMTDDIGLKKLVPVVVTGCGASADQGGMTRAQQIEAVKNFKWGSSRVAVATSVAEEGMDVTRCSRVIRYEYVSNEIGMIQARGRASRVQDGTYYTVTAKKEVALKERANIRLEAVMEETVDELQRQIETDLEGFKSKLDQIQKDEKTSRETEKQKAMEQPLTDEEFQLKCYYCNTHAFSSHDIRVVANSHRLVVTDIWHLVNEKEPENKDKFDNMQKISAVHCKECQARWGSGVMYNKVKYVCISIYNFMAYEKNKRSHHWSKWKKVHFKCKDMPKDQMEVATSEDRMIEN